MLNQPLSPHNANPRRINLANTVIPIDPHPLLAQVPLTVSPFLSLPTPTPLPYTYKQLPSTLPPSILSTTSTSTSAPDPSNQPAYIVSASGQTATPDSILTSCLALQSHLAKLEVDAQKTLRDWEESRRARELAEKRRVAPGWLDADVHLLKPENVSGGAEEVSEQDFAMSEGTGQPSQRRVGGGVEGLVESREELPDDRQGEELDRAFGGMGLQ
jgi:hypothetical protein